LLGKRRTAWRMPQSSHRVGSSRYGGGVHSSSSSSSSNSSGNFSRWKRCSRTEAPWPVHRCRPPLPHLPLPCHQDSLPAALIVSAASFCLQVGKGLGAPGYCWPSGQITCAHALSSAAQLLGVAVQSGHESWLMTHESCAAGLHTYAPDSCCASRVWVALG